VSGVFAITSVFLPYCTESLTISLRIELSKHMGREVNSRTAADRNSLRIRSIKAKAAGIPAVTSSLKHGITRMGAIRTIRTLKMVNQEDGFDCPGCAWPDPEHRTTFEFCENGAKAVADEAMKRKINANFFNKYSVSELSKKSDLWLNKQGRLTQPMILKTDQNNYQPISWNDAFELISKRILSLDNPNRAAFYTSGRTSNEAAFLYQAFVRSLGTNNLPDCSNMCHESSGKGLGATIGTGKGTVLLDDFNSSDLIIVIGQNPGTNHPRMLTALRDSKHNGAKIIHVNPLPEAGLVRFKHPQDYMKGKLKSTRLADIHLQVKIGGDAALLKGLIKVVDSQQSTDDEFIKTFTEGYESMIQEVRQTSWKKIVNDSGIDQVTIEKAGKMCAESSATIACWAMGLTQHRNAVSVIQEVVNLLLMGGHIGRPGAGLCPVRGHSNVQGDRTVGIWEAPSKAFLDKLEKGLGFSPPSKHGFDVVNTIRAMRDKKVDVFFCMGGNFLSATPDTDVTSKALNNVGLTVQVSTKLNRSHLVTGDTALILPCLGRTEIDIQGDKKQFVTVENSMGIVHRSQGGLKPSSKLLRSEPWIVSQLATKCGLETLDWQSLVSNYDNIRDLMSRSLNGFENYNKRVREPSGFTLPNPPRDSRTFNTASGLAQFTTHNLPDVSVGEGNYVMMTIRSHDQYNTTIYDLHDRYRGIHGNRRVILMNEKDMAKQGWKKKQQVTLVSHYDGTERIAKSWSLVPYDIPVGNVATYFPESNCLVPLDSTAEISNTPTSKWIEVSDHAE